MESPACHDAEATAVLEALGGHEAGLTAAEVARMTDLPVKVVQDHLDALDRVQEVLRKEGPPRYRTLEPPTS